MKQLIFLSIIFFIAVSVLSGQVPQNLSYQGLLTDMNGEPMNGNFNLTFKLYTDSAGSSSLWEESQNIKISDGIFNVILGSVNPLDIPFDKVYWLGISVGTDNELETRIQLTASPYSLIAQTVADTSVSTIKLKNGAVTNAKLADGSVTGLKLSDNALQAGSNVTITRLSNGAFEIGATGGGGGFSLPFSGSISSSDPALSIGNSGNGNGITLEAGQDGIVVEKAGNPIASLDGGKNRKNGFEVKGAEDDGLYVGRADQIGVNILSTGSNGIQVAEAGIDGLQVQVAGRDGVRISSAWDYGINASGSKGAAYLNGDVTVTGAMKGFNGPNNGAPYPRPAYDSGWIGLAIKETKILQHNIGGNADDYVVDMTFKNNGGIRQPFRDLYAQQSLGADWENLTNESVTINRLGYISGAAIELIRVRIWVIQ